MVNYDIEINNEYGETTQNKIKLPSIGLNQSRYAINTSNNGWYSTEFHGNQQLIHDPQPEPPILYHASSYSSAPRGRKKMVKLSKTLKVDRNMTPNTVSTY